MKKLLALLLACTMLLSLTACGGGGNTDAGNNSDGEKTEITLWTYPVGKFGDEATVKGFVAAFEAKYPDYTVKVQYLDYTNGDAQVTAAIEGKKTPDIILEGPERLVSNWGAKGLMVDLADLWDDEALADISKTSEAVVAACKGADGKYYEYPFCMTTHTMAINKELFEKAGAMQYINEDRTWTVENFEKALKAVKAYKGEGAAQVPAMVYCGGQGGDQGTRALAMNLFSASFTNAAHNEWTMNSEAGIKGLTQLQSWAKEGLVEFNAAAVASDELQAFAQGTVAVSFCWNAANQSQYASQAAFTPYPVAFPSEDGKPELCGGIWGFGIFNNGDDAKIEGAKKFIEFICDDAEQGPKSVVATGFFPVRSSYGNPYAGTADEERMGVFASFQQYLGDYYNVTLGWAEQRTAWWNMLQKVGKGEDVKTVVNEYVNTCNQATKDASK